MNDLIELERDKFERAFRIEVWNAARSANMKDDAAIELVKRRVEAVKASARAALTKAQGDGNGI